MTTSTSHTSFCLENDSSFLISFLIYFLNDLKATDDKNFHVFPVVKETDPLHYNDIIYTVVRNRIHFLNLTVRYIFCMIFKQQM